MCVSRIDSLTSTEIDVCNVTPKYLRNRHYSPLKWEPEAAHQAISMCPAFFNPFQNHLLDHLKSLESTLPRAAVLSILSRTRCRLFNLLYVIVLEINEHV